MTGLRDGPGPPTHPAELARTSQPELCDGFEVPDMDVPAEPPPAYGDRHDHLRFSQPGFNADAEVRDNGRVAININTTSTRFRDILAPVLDRQAQVALQQPLPPAYVPPSLGGRPGQTPPPKLNVVIQIVGSRGDVQPFVALGKVLKDTYGHRVRLATHATFKPFVEESGLEFFNIGGDPAELMAFMVKYPGLMPGFDAVKSGEVTKRRKGVQDILVGCWRSCIEAGDGFGPPPKPHPKNKPLDLSQGLPGHPASDPFVADAIISNPPAFAHVHIAEKLGIPLHMMFTMPWSPTRAFPHPLADIQKSNADDVMTNYLSYTLVEMVTWQGLGDIINRFREKVLDLAPLSLIWAPGLINRLKISYTYCWSPALIPKPNDWGPNIDISGFFFLDLASNYNPESALAAFLDGGSPPVYIGFGSIVADDPDAMTRLIFEAVQSAGVRALVSKGWGGLGADDIGVPEGVFMLGNVPHDWLFERVSCVVHHGGAGTTAAGIKAGKPTVVVPFFGDQPFWGTMISRAEAGPDPIPHKQLTAEKLAEAISFCLKPSTQEQAKQLGARIQAEKGAEMGGQSFHCHLDVDSLRCSLAPSRVAVWQVKKTDVRLCAFAAAVLVEEGHLRYSDLRLYRSKEHNTEDQPPDPISAAASSLVMDMSSIGMAIADMPRELFQSRQKGKDKQQAPMESATGKYEHEALPDLDEKISTGLSSRPEVQGEAPRQRGTGSMATPTKGRGHASGSRSTQAVSSEDPPSPGGVSLESVLGAGRGVEKIVSTGVKSPMNFCLGLAKGFRNVPRLYHDDTVRPVEKVTDLGSGIKVASKELGYGVFDGISGLVTQPLRGAEKEGAGGLVKGFGKGIGGLIAKPAAGFWGVPAYAMQGVQAELNKFLTRSSQNYIITSRVIQGQQDLASATTAERADVVARWHQAGGSGDLKGLYTLGHMKDSGPSRGSGKRAVVSDSTTSSRSRFHKHGPPSTSSFLEDKQALRHEQQNRRETVIDSKTSPAASTGSSSISADDAEFERAIQMAVRETSTGNAEEDAMIEAAMRQSVTVLQNQPADEASPRAGRSTEKHRRHGIFDDEDYQITDEEYQRLVEEAVQRSLAHHSGDLVSPRDVTALQAGSWRGGDFRDDDDNDDLQRAIAASKEDMERQKSGRNEEDIVLEYMKKQSLAEEEHRKNTGRAICDDEDDDDMKRAVEASLKS